LKFEDEKHKHTKYLTFVARIFSWRRITFIMLILCDFDGTITEFDITNLIWDRYLESGWRERLLPAYRAGKATTFELMSAGYGEIAFDAPELLNAIRSEMRLRAGFENFANECSRLKHSLHVISCGLDWYIQAMLPAGIPYHCYLARFKERWSLSLPPDITLAPAEDFKVCVLKKLLQEQTGKEKEKTIFIGDGWNDFPIAKLCDRVFSVKNSTLSKRCREAHIAFEEFESFQTLETAVHCELKR
jgi:2-hydroxy-3-keto-5-methylthiopentenyl-1-phosphate phosphatase